MHYGIHYLFQANKFDYGSIHSVPDTSPQGHQTPSSEEIDSQGKVQSEKHQVLISPVQQTVPQQDCCLRDRVLF